MSNPPDDPSMPADAAVTLRPYRQDDEDNAIALWQRTWQLAYPSIDFAARVAWWRERWRRELVTDAHIIVAERNGEMLGFATIDRVGYMDQIVVGPEAWGTDVGTRLLDEAKLRSPHGITLLVNNDNARAIGFYQKNGFIDAGDEVNPVSGRPVKRMRWRP